MKTNFGMLSSPFSWDFEKLARTGFLPGKSRAQAVLLRLKQAPAIDGDVNDPAWADAPWIDVPEVSLGKTQAATRMRLGYDDKSIYVAFECDEPLMEDTVLKEYGHDGAVYNTECVEMFLAPDGVGQKRVQLCLAPTKEGRWEGRYGYIDDPLNPLSLSGSADISWNPQYRTAYRVDREAKKWTMGIAFPFEQLGITAPAEGTRWRGNFGRERHMEYWGPKYPDQNEWSLWSPNLQGAAFPDPAAFGDIYFGSIPPAGQK